MPRGRPYKCIYCGSAATVSKGVRVTKTLGIHNIRRCKSCGRKFTPKNQKVIPVEGDQTNESQTGSANEDPSTALVSNDTEDSVPTEPEESLPNDPQGIELTEADQPTNGY
jgi:uncharacterized Zn finger protein